MALVNMESHNVIVGDYVSKLTKEAGISLIGSPENVIITARNKEMLDHIIAGLERAKIELDRMKTKYIADEPVEVKYNDTLSN